MADNTNPLLDARNILLDTSQILGNQDMILDISQILNTPKEAGKENNISGPYYYTYEGKYLGSTNQNINEVRLGKDAGKTPSGTQRYTPVDIEGNDRSTFIILHTDHLLFKQIFGTLYTEVDAWKYTKEEAAGIYSIFENRSETMHTSIGPILFEKTAIYGWKNPKGIIPLTTQQIIESKSNEKDKKYIAVFKGLVMGITDNFDYSYGATVWQGRDFKQHTSYSQAHELYYLSGFFFNASAHDIFNMGDHPNDDYKITYVEGGVTRTIILRYKYASVGAEGGTIFMKRTWWSFSDDIVIKNKIKPNFPAIQKYYTDNYNVLSTAELKEGMENLIRNFVKGTANF